MVKRWSIVGLLIIGMALAGCVNYAGATYQGLSLAEQSAKKVETKRCDALEQGANALRDEDGEDFALRIPFGSAAAIKDLAYRHDRQAAVCREYVTRHGRTKEQDRRILEAWQKLWRSGDAIIEGDF